MFIYQCCPSCMIHNVTSLLSLHKQSYVSKEAHTHTHKHAHAYAKTRNALHYNTEHIQVCVKSNLICITGFPRNSSLSNSTNFHQETPLKGTAVNWSAVSQIWIRAFPQWKTQPVLPHAVSVATAKQIWAYWNWQHAN